MIQRLEKLRLLRELYLLRAFGHRYQEPSLKKEGSFSSFSAKNIEIKHCHLCERSKTSEPIEGILNLEARLTFITELPIVNVKNEFLQTRSAKMLNDIWDHIFSKESISVLSILKCGSESNPKSSEIEICKTHLHWQLDQIKQTHIICFGGTESLKIFDYQDAMLFGKIQSYKKHKLMVTYSLKDLIKNPSLKKEALKHLMAIKENL